MSFSYRDETKELNDLTRKEASGSFIQLSDGVTHYELSNAEAENTVVLAHGFSVPYFIYDPDSAAFLLLVDDRSASLGLDHLHRFMKLRSAITFNRAENVAGQTLGMDANECRHIGVQLARIDNDKFLVTRQRTVTNDLKIAA